MSSTSISLFNRQTCAPANNGDSQKQLSLGHVSSLKPITGYPTQSLNFLRNLPQQASNAPSKNSTSISYKLRIVIVGAGLGGS
jgi:hypothetical protein